MEEKDGGEKGGREREGERRKRIEIRKGVKGGRKQNGGRGEERRLKTKATKQTIKTQ